jgi:hypothetical protein
MEDSACSRSKLDKFQPLVERKAHYPNFPALISKYLWDG